MSFIDVLKNAGEELPWLRWPAVILAAIVGIVVLYAIGLTTVAYNQNGVIAGYPFGQNIHLPRNAIIMIEEECRTLPGWIPFKRAFGRIPIGAGTGSDINNVARTFEVQAEDERGEYVHTLSVDEMPAHSHNQRGHVSGTHRCKGDCYEYSTDGYMVTGTTGSSQAHNNMPPTFTMNFCVQR